MKRKVLLFLLVLTVMLAIKYAVGQENAPVAFDPSFCRDCRTNDPLTYVFVTMLLSPLAGICMGVARVMAQGRGRPIVEPVSLHW